MNEEDIPGELAVAYHVRGRQRRSWVTMRCVTLQDIIRQGEELFPLFQARNPWISVDSQRNTVFVGLDPERQEGNGETRPTPTHSETKR